MSGACGSRFRPARPHPAAIGGPRDVRRQRQGQRVWRPARFAPDARHTTREGATRADDGMRAIYERRIRRRLIGRFPWIARRGAGRHPADVSWLAGMLGAAETGRLPIVFADLEINLSGGVVPSALEVAGKSALIARRATGRNRQCVDHRRWRFQEVSSEWCTSLSLKIVRQCRCAGIHSDWTRLAGSFTISWLVGLRHRRKVVTAGGGAVEREGLRTASGAVSMGDQGVREICAARLEFPQGGPGGIAILDH